MFRFRIHSSEYRQLKEELSELSDLYTILAERFKRWDARQRQRAKRGILDADIPDVADVAPRSDSGGGGADAIDVRQLALPVGDDANRDRTATRERLHQLAKARGLR